MANHWVLLLCFALQTAMAAAATQFRVGGSGTWAVPTDPNAMSYNQWAQRNRFQIGDSLLFVYSPEKDSVLRVDKAAYESCNTSSYIQRFNDGSTVVVLDQSGPVYFISGVEHNCIRKESLLVVVMADRSNRASVSNPPTVPPSPSPAAPAALPPSPSPDVLSPPSLSPSPPPSDLSPPPTPEVSSSPPSLSPPSPSGSTEAAPSPAASGVESSPPSPPPPNGASPKVVMGLIGSIGGLALGWLFVL